MPKHKLLESLVQYVSHGILSNLRTPEGLQCAVQAAKALKPQDFSLDEWEDALGYITGKQCRFATSQQAFDYLLSLKQ